MPRWRSDLAMHVAASNPQYLAAARRAGGRRGEGARHPHRDLKNDEKNKGKPENMLVKIVEGGIDKWLGEITLLGQPFVKDGQVSIEKLLQGAGAQVVRFARLEVGAGIEKKQDDFVAEVMAQAEAQKQDDEKVRTSGMQDPARRGFFEQWSRT